MVSEGVDIPRLRLGRVRHHDHHRAVLPPGRRPLRAPHRRPGGRRTGLAVHPRRPAPAHLGGGHRRGAPPQPAEAAPHGGRGRARRLADDAAFDEVAEQRDEQLSLFAVLSAQVVDGRRSPLGVRRGPRRPDERRRARRSTTAACRWTCRRRRRRAPAGTRCRCPEDLGGRPLAEVKRELREANADLALHLVRFTGLSHREVNGRLNRLSRRAADRPRPRSTSSVAGPTRPSAGSPGSDPPGLLRALAPDLILPLGPE